MKRVHEPIEEWVELNVVGERAQISRLLGLSYTVYIGIPKNVYVTESVMTESLKSLVKTFCVSPCGSYKIDQ